jgi:hypothetical protein
MLKALPHMKYGRKALWDCYMLHANEHGHAWLSRETICAETGLSHPVVIAARAWLVAHGALVDITDRVRDHYKQNGAKVGRATIYYVTGEIRPCNGEWEDDDGCCAACTEGLEHTYLLEFKRKESLHLQPAGEEAGAKHSVEVSPGEELAGFTTRRAVKILYSYEDAEGDSCKDSLPLSGLGDGDKCKDSLQQAGIRKGSLPESDSWSLRESEHSKNQESSGRPAGRPPPLDGQNEQHLVDFWNQHFGEPIEAGLRLDIRELLGRQIEPAWIERAIVEADDYLGEDVSQVRVMRYAAAVLNACVRESREPRVPIDKRHNANGGDQAGYDYAAYNNTDDDIDEDTPRAGPEPPQPAAAMYRPASEVVAGATCDLPLADAWTFTQSQLRLQMDRSAYEAYVARAQAINLERVADGQRLVVCVRGGYERQWLTERLAPSCALALEGVLGVPLAVRFVTPAEDIGANDFDSEMEGTKHANDFADP